MWSALDFPQLVLDLKKEDVLFGRGKRAHAWKGNVMFRRMCEDAAVAYAVAADGDAKDAIVQDIVSSVQSSGGMFLRELEIINADGRKRTVWQTVTLSMIRTKVKQACRDSIRIRQRLPNPKPDNRNSQDLPEGHQHILINGKPNTTIVLTPHEQVHLSNEVSTSSGGADTVRLQLPEHYQPSDRELEQALLSWYTLQEARTVVPSPWAAPRPTERNEQPSRYIPPSLVCPSQPLGSIRTTVAQVDDNRLLLRPCNDVCTCSLGEHLDYAVDGIGSMPRPNQSHGIDSSLISSSFFDSSLVDSIALVDAFGRLQGSGLFHRGLEEDDVLNSLTPGALPYPDQDLNQSIDDLFEM